VAEPVPPALPGLLPVGAVAATAASILAVQEPSGAIPWYPGGHVDPWDHVECAMGLTVAGAVGAARRALRFLSSTQRRDGSWPCRLRQRQVEDATAETNQCAYLAVGVWQHFLATGDAGFAAGMWPTVRRAIDFVVSLQDPGGVLPWAVRPDGRVADGALLTGCASTYQSLRAALALARLVGEEQPDWELAAGLLGHAVAEHPEAFLDKARYSMDWYYPVLGGAVRGDAARRRITERWAEFVIPGFGARCVADRPWVTGAETCELALALDTVGDRDGALALVADMQRLRAPDGSYWTGLVVADGKLWPVERSTWTAGAVLLAAAALSGAPGGGIFRGEGLPEPLPLPAGRCSCAAATR
jgi:hypothetical protein